MSPREVSKWSGLSRAELASRWGRESVHLFGKVGSTNDVAGALADDGAPAGTVVLAREQTAGRGRAGRRWESPPGAGVYVSVIFRPEHVSNPGLVPILAGLGVTLALDRAFEGLSPRLKWPNDVMVQDRKCAGVLGEASWSNSRARHLLVGVGLNVRPATGKGDAALPGATSLQAALDRKVPLVEAADAVIQGLESALSTLPESMPAATLDVLDRYDWLRDRRVAVSLPGDETTTPGVCAGIAPDGALLFRPDRGALRRLTEGEIHVEAGP